MKTYSETIKLIPGVEATMYLNVHEEENYTGVAAYLNDTCAYEKKVHGICTTCNDLPESIVDPIGKALFSAYSGCPSEEAVDCKFID